MNILRSRGTSCSRGEWFWLATGLVLCVPFLVMVSSMLAGFGWLEGPCA